MSQANSTRRGCWAVSALRRAATRAAVGVAGVACSAPALGADQAAVVVAGAAASAVTAVTQASLTTASLSVASVLRPHVRNNLASPMAQRLELAFPVALRRVGEKPSCRALFEELGAKGADKLGATLYYGADDPHSRQVCRMGARALTPPGTVITRLCPRFAKLSTEDAALTLIHEALHFAGLPERPLAPEAMSSTEINDLVKQRCFR